MKRFGFFTVIVVGAIWAACCVVGCGRERPEDKPLVFYVGGTIEPAMAELAKMYERKTGQKIEIDKSGSGELLTRIRMNKSADVFICHDPFMDELMEGKKGQLGVDAWTVAQIIPVIVVQKGNPRRIKGLGDLMGEGTKVVVTDLEYSTCGHMLPTMFAKAGIEIGVEDKKVMLRKGAVAKEIVTYRSGGRTADTIKNRKFDAAIVWNAVAYLRRDGLEVVSIGEHLPKVGMDVDTVTSASGKVRDLGRIRVTLVTLKCSKRPEAARKFAEFIASQKGCEVLKRFGFADVGGAIKEYENGKKLIPQTAPSVAASQLPPKE